jgi:hypothetical protein
MSVFDTIINAESGGRNIQSTAGTTSSGTAEGYYQITPGTWHDFAPSAGISLAQYPTPMSAPIETQTQVASMIPLSRWAPSTVAAVQAQYGTVNTGQTLGQINLNTGGGSLASYTGVSPVTGPDGIPTINVTPSGTYGQPATSDGGGSGSGGTTTGATGLDVGWLPPSQTGGPMTLGLATGVVSSISGWISGIETSVGNAFTGAVSGVLGTAGNYLMRFFLILIGLVVLAIGLWALIPESTKQNMARTAAIAA